jgi:uncharacterized membrane protein
MEQATIFASIVAAAIADVSFACAVGSCFAVLMLRDAPPLTRDRLRRFARGGIAILIVANIVNLLLEAALISGSAAVAALAEIVPVLTQSHFGAAWLSGLVSLIVWTVLLVGSRSFGRSAPTGLALFAAAIFAFTKAVSTHAADAGDFSLPEWVHCVHLCATAAVRGLGRRGPRPVCRAPVARRARCLHRGPREWHLQRVSGRSRTDSEGPNVPLSDRWHENTSIWQQIVLQNNFQVDSERPES